MATLLALDWERRHVHLLAGSVNSRGGVRVERALAWEEDDLTTANAEAAGQRLAKRLKEARIAPTAVLACLGRERVVFKEIRYPNVGAAEEPAVVRFQASKELTEPAETVIIDYVPLEGTGPAGEKRALIVVARRHEVNAWKAFCRGAGIKLAAVTPRPFGVASCLALAEAPPEKGVAAAVLTVCDGWAEFAVVRGQQLLFARPMAANGSLMGEVRRNLALYAGQAHITNNDAVHALYVAGNADAPLLRELQNTLAIPVHLLDPFAGQTNLPYAGDRAGFTGAVGLIRGWGERQELPVNFVAPKEAKPVVNPNKRKLTLFAVAGCVCLLAMIFVGSTIMDGWAAELADAKQHLESVETKLKSLQPDAKAYAAVAEWHASAVPVVDEIYDITAHFPYRTALRVTQLSLAPLQGAKPYSVRMMMTGTVLKADAQLVQQFIDTINRENGKFCRAALVSMRAAGSGEADKGSELFSIKVDIARRDPEHFAAKLEPPAATSGEGDPRSKSKFNSRRGFGGNAP